MDATRKCEEPGCERQRSPKAGYGRCALHYQKHKQAGTIHTLKPKHLRAKTAEEKFYRYVSGTISCWWWEGPKNQRGYGVLAHDGDESYAHRWAWEHLIGSIPAGMTIDHLCANKLCVNPEHLELVSIGVNSSRRHGNRVFCPRGHAMQDAYERPDGDGRMCRTCTRERTKRRWEARKTLVCEFCARTLSSENMRAHQKKNCHGPGNPWIATREETSA